MNHTSKHGKPIAKCAKRDESAKIFNLRDKHERLNAKAQGCKDAKRAEGLNRLP